MVNVTDALFYLNKIMDCSISALLIASLSSHIAKAYDSVDILKLFKKLDTSGIKGTSQKWFGS